MKRQRRTREQLEKLLGAVKRIIGEQNGDAMTIRHLFYLLVSSGDLDKTENALRNTVEGYRKNLWQDQNDYVELWCEKDAISSVLSDVAAPFGVGVFPLRGYSSLSALHTAAVTFKSQQRRGKQVYVYYFGDHDPSGQDIDRAAAESLRDDFGVKDVTFIRKAVTPLQIKTLNLQTRPTKKSDARSKNFEGRSVDVDAIPPAELRRIAKHSILQHIDSREWEAMERTEELEKASLERVMKTFRAGA